MKIILHVLESVLLLGCYLVVATRIFRAEMIIMSNSYVYKTPHLRGIKCLSLRRRGSEDGTLVFLSLNAMSFPKKCGCQHLARLQKGNEAFKVLHKTGMSKNTACPLEYLK